MNNLGTHDTGLPSRVPVGQQPFTAGVPDCIKQPSDRAAVIQMLDEWLADDTGYDEAVWPQLKAALNANRDGARRLFDE